MDRSIKIRIPEEVTFAVFVSGGIDSSIVAIQTKKFLNNKENNKINSYGIKYKSCVTDDNIISKKLTKKLGFDFNDKNIQIKEIIKNIDSVIKSMDSPYGSLRQNGLFTIHKRAKKDGIKVVLTGDGADEFNLGYYFSYPGFGLDLEKIKTKNNFKKKLEEKIKISSEILKNYDKEKINNKILDRYIDNYCDIKDNKKVIDMVKSLYFKKFLPYKLKVNDRSSMYNSIESRTPFCNHKLAEKSFFIPLEFQIKNKIEKKILRNSYKNILPEYIVNRKKTPTPESCDTELYLKIIELLEEKISNNNAKFWNDILNKEKVVEIIKEAKNDILNRENNLNQVKPSFRDLLFSKFQYRIENIFAVLTIIRWYEIYFET